MVGLLPLPVDVVGAPDPATALMEQIRHDPYEDALSVISRFLEALTH